MKIKKLIIVFALLAVLFGACGKGHYDLDNVQGVALEGEVLVPVASGNYTIMEMMERFGIDSLITFSATGGMQYHYSYEHKNAVSGHELLHFRNENLYKSWSLPEIALQTLASPIDTVIHYSHTLVLQSDHINVFNALVKTGKIYFKLGVANAAVQVRRFRIHCPEITDRQGNEFWCEILQADEGLEVDLNGYSFQTEEPNTFHFDFRLEVRLNPSTLPAGKVEFMMQVEDLTVSEMLGWLEPHNSYSEIVTDFDIFPDNVMGTLELEDVELRLQMRNGFHVPTRLVIDTAEVTGFDFETIQIFEVLPQVIEMDFSSSYVEIFHRSMAGVIGAHGAIAKATSTFTLNPNGLTDRITVADTCSVAVRADVDIPLSFTANEVHYLDTVIMNLSENLSGTLPMLESPEWVKKLTLELNLTSNIPLDLEGRIMMYDAENDEITDVLVDDFILISASFDGQPVERSVSIEVTDERIGKMMQANRMILDFGVDTQAREVELTPNQFLRFFAKCKVEYDGNVKLKSE